MQWTPQQEADWIDRAQKGDMVAFRTLYDTHLRRVSLQVARLVGPHKAEIEDVIQHVFIQVHRSLPSFDGRSKFSTWLYRLTFNVATSYLRKRKPTTDLDSLREFAADEDQWSKLVARDKLRVLYGALDDLPEEYRDAFLLFELDGLSLKEIAEMTQVTLNTAASRVRRSRERLRELLETCDVASASTPSEGGRS